MRKAIHLLRMLIHFCARIICANFFVDELMFHLILFHVDISTDFYVHVSSMCTVFIVLDRCFIVCYEFVRLVHESFHTLLHVDGAVAFRTKFKHFLVIKNVYTKV